MRTLPLNGSRNSSRLPTLLLAAGLAMTPWAPALAAGMEGMDHGSHSMPMGASSDAPAQSRTPIPPVTDADRAAVYTSHSGHQVHDSAINSYFVADKLEWQDANDGSALAWDLSGWIGGDIDRLLLRSEGERTNGKTEEAEVQALWGHAVSSSWDVVAGARQDFKPGAPQTWAAFGLQGQAISDLDVEATAFIGDAGQTAARLEADYDLLLTNDLILQPTGELNFYGKNDPQRGNGSGLSTSEFGLRLRYEITPQFAPYVGVTWNRSYGKTADYAREDDEDVAQARLVVGLRLWF
ncbi:Copper resistance protein B -like protein [Pseudomonas syringae pv. tomato]|uniref:Copper resistance protein B homolog n=2 Tax=Pseudomonas syringae group genomosp. 3 TaxID=251701 RepID=COPB_PSESM|nr:RecName: Full=Copper resistance protein B homolog; Flags: Precursor [Pseudomonas syringae pv. tomato str. DC3000]KPX76076.1 Copper resistance protein B -like protein [Pseudomonas syringae pv. maculicola]KPY93670.1 Copper resistance protein B -like protein [Pseudomonas syringae pv. tomato]MBW8021063.1 copper resistance protein B [Pseudomonas syringae pv. tomato]PYD06235.1 copper resistance protein CopB [Pseudomonas syringae pv. maculicola]RMM82915.1 Copper resistance protein B -like protein 